MRLFNTLTKQDEEFKPINAELIGVYTCGPTVYDYAHLGNFRAYVFADVLRRTLEYSGYQVKHVMNITDVDDKTIRNSQAAGSDLKTFTQKYEEEFFADCAKLNILKPKVTPRATEHIAEMITLIERLLTSELAYQAEDGIYFSISRSPAYGLLAGLKEDRKNISRIKNDDYDKESPQDFALWKFRTEADGPNTWPAPFGEGRPGWHIECSAMSTKYLGDTFDIHTGGVDLIFPHHTNEIAQSEGASGKPLANYWLHSGHVVIDGEKMSKSLGNTLRVGDLANFAKKEISPLAYRYWLLTAQYRTTINLTTEALSAAQIAYDKLISFVAEGLAETGEINESWRERFKEKLANDLNTPEALALVWSLIKDGEVSPADKIATILDFDRILGLDLESQAKLLLTPLPDEVQALVGDREKARAEKDFAAADDLRQKIENLGYEIKDTESGPTLKPRA